MMDRTAMIEAAKAWAKAKIEMMPPTADLDAYVKLHDELTRSFSAGYSRGHNDGLSGLPLESAGTGSLADGYAEGWADGRKASGHGGLA